MAAARLPCRCFKTRVLHFKVKNTPLEDKKWTEKVQKNAQLSFCGGREAFHQEIVLRGIHACGFTSVYEPVILFLCFAPFVFLGSIVLTSLFSLFYVTREFNRFLHRG